MKRLFALFFALTGVMYSSSTLAAVCFLADTECQEGKFSVDKTAPCRDQNSSWLHENELCKGLVYGNVVCNDATGNYYEDGSCPTGYTDFGPFASSNKYKCADNPNASLLCDRCCKNIVCQDRYHVCEHNSVPKYPSDECVEPGSNTKKYTECVCRDPYKWTCTGTAITNGTGGYCVDDDGKRFYKDCQCSSGYTEVSLSDIKCPDRCEYGCTLGTKFQRPDNSSKYCWSGAECSPKPEPQCTISYQSDFDNFWQGYDAATDCSNLTVDCSALGYDTGTAETGVKCKDGSEPYRCPFDHTEVYCESGIEDTGDTCTYTTASECEAYYFGSLCQADGDGCYNPYACATGYGKTIKECSGGKAGNWSLGSYDDFGCAECECTRVCDNEYTGSLPDNAEWVSGSCASCGITTTVHIGWKCKTGYQKNVAGTGCILSTCPTGYAKTADDCYNKGSAGWSLDLTDKYDSTDCYKCIAKSCEAGYSTDITSIADCGTTGSAGYTFTKSESGYSGDDACGKCECTDPCEDTYTGEIPENAHAVTEACKACDKEKDIVTDWACDDGYVINSAKTGCIPSTCPTGYAKVASECSASGSGAWHLDMNNRYDSTDCYKCEPDACENESSTTITISQCGNKGIGDKGWFVSETGYSGEDKCYTCEELACEGDYSTDVTTCEAGYKLVTNGYSGDDACGKCEEKDCSTGYSKSITSEADCSAGYTFEQDPDNPLCGMCKEASCPTGYSTDVTSAEDCKTDNEYEGWSVETKGMSGTKQCNKCVCENLCQHAVDPSKIPARAHEVTETCNACDEEKEIVTGWKCNNGFELNEAGDGCICPSGSYYTKSECESAHPNASCASVAPANVCYKFSACDSGYALDTNGVCVPTCPDGFTAGLTDPSQCGVGGEDGWFVEFNGNESCGLCTPKTCGDHGLESTRYNTVCLSEKVYIGNDLVDCYDCVGCDTFDTYNLSGSLYDVYRDSIDIPCSEWCRYDKSTPDITEQAIPYLIYKKSVKDKAGRSGDCYGLIDVPGKWEIETNEKKMCCCLYGEDLTASGCPESGQ